MGLRWWPVGLAGLTALVVVVVVALWLPIPQRARMLRPLAHVRRLTDLPLYQRIAQLRLVSLIATAILVVLLFAATMVTSARPVGFDSATRAFAEEHPEDIMLCIGQPVTDPTTAGFLNYYLGQLGNYTTQRIGLSSPTLRVVPLTRDYGWTEEQFASYARLPELRRDQDARRPVSAEDAVAITDGIESFSRTVDYVDYAPSTEDVLALCMAGFPSFENRSDRRRAVIYLGYTDFRGSAETRPSLYTTQAVKDMAAAGGIQINGIARTDVVADPAINDSLASITEATGGQFAVYNPVGGAGTVVEPTLAAILERVGANPPSAVLPNGTLLTERTWDYPNLPLAISLILAAVLCGSLAVLRR